MYCGLACCHILCEIQSPLLSFQICVETLLSTETYFWKIKPDKFLNHRSKIFHLSHLFSLPNGYMDIQISIHTNKIQQSNTKKGKLWIFNFKFITSSRLHFQYGGVSGHLFWAMTFDQETPSEVNRYTCICL